VFLDRDGVLNEAVIRDGKPYPPPSIDDLRITDGAAVGLARLKESGFLLLVVTNQPDVARGTQTMATIDKMHRAIAERLPVDEFLVCAHDDRDQCSCRKPAPGLLLEGASRHHVDLSRSFMIGDRWRDIDAGRAAGCRTVFIDYGYRERGPSVEPDARVKSLPAAVDWIMGQETNER
jgi:D-glycero-D-manno-heptose 1,7-bisphosphate phosphatase